MRGRPRSSRIDTPTSDDRTVRLFVSSTFQDMYEERAVLQRDVFPIVRRFLWERGITFIDVDLRWGVTREEAEQGEVLDICLREIDRCRPWIIGLLGARYGWVDPTARDRLKAAPHFSGLLNYTDVSVTEFELRHAITDRPPLTPGPAALLYWRVAPSVDTPFKALVADIEQAGVEIRPAVPDLQIFAQVVRDELLALIERQMPPRPALPPAQFLARRRMEEARETFVDRPETQYLHRLACSLTGRFALTGPEGCGKSAVMSATARAMEVEGRIRFVGALTPGGFRNWIGAFKSVLAQLGEQGRGVAAGPAAVAQRFHDAVKAAAALAPLCVLIDDVETDPDAQDALAWLPDAIPNAVIIVALRGGDQAAAQAERLGYHVVNIGPPDRHLAREMIERSLMAYARRLDDQPLRQLLSRDRSARDYLILSEEVRQTQRFEDLDAAVEELAALDGSDALAGRALARVLQGRPWASELLLALAASEVGLSDETLQQIARDGGERGAPIDIRLLREAIGDYATEAAGRTLLMNSAFRRVILESRGTLDQARVRKIMIAACLACLEAPGSPEEILTQAAAIGDWREFAGLMARPDLAEALMRRAPEALAAAWGELSAHLAITADPVYGAWAGVEPPDRVALAAEFLVARGARDVAERCATDALARAAEADAATRVRANLVLARVAEMAGHLNKAEQFSNDVAGLAATLGAGAIQALAAANALRLSFLREGASAVIGRAAPVRHLAAQHPDGRALATVTLVEGLAALERADHSTARGRFEELKRMSLRDDDLAACAAAEAGLARTEFARGRRKSAARRARTVEAVGEALGDSRLVLEGLAIRTAVATDDIAGFGEARHLIQIRRRRANEAGDEIALIEADMDEAILMAGQGALRTEAHDRALRVIDRARALGLQRLEAKIRHLLGNATI